ncbi:MAG: ubiquitin-like protein UBact [Fimbriimonadaceae bacterium]|nr:ubiquitin-like protein UBact [Chthonomonadaceae bacterium]MCO5295821.1 ubiquitin-like protein UBact [Fimbriimonadaceae bacterium]
MTRGDDRLRKPAQPGPTRKGSDQPGPAKPDVQRPDGGNELLRRMRKVDPDQARKYRQRSGQ